MNVSYVYDISDNTKSGVFYHEGSDTYNAVEDDFKNLIEKYKAEYSASANTTLSATYTYGVEYFNKKGYIYPYEEVSTADLKEVVTVDQIYNLDSFNGIPNIVLLVVDDIGWNDFDLGLWDSSLFKGDAFPAMKALMQEGGITITNHISAAYCSPARGQLLTGKYSSYVNMDGTTSQLHIDEATIGHEMKSAGYYTAHVGKWGVGWTKSLYTPLYKGFDQSFGYYGNSAHKYKKEINNGDQIDLEDVGYDGSYVDLWENGVWAGTESLYFGEGMEDAELDAYLPKIFSNKVENFLGEYSEKDTDAPFFLYFASDLAHSPYVAPEYYVERCNDSIIVNNSTEDDIEAIKRKCAMMLVLDETIGNLTCKLESLGMAENTLFAFASDNGGDLVGDNLPYVGKKFYELQGGFSTPAAVFGALIPEEKRGTSYSNLFHGSDWLPTLMQVATKGKWTGSVLGDHNTLNGVNHWETLIGATDSDERPRDSALTYVDSDGRISMVGYYEDGLFHYSRGLMALSAQDAEIVISVKSSSDLLCDMEDIPWAGSTTADLLMKGAQRLFLRARSTIIGASSGSTGKGIMIHFPVTLFVVAVALSVGVLVRNSLSRRSSKPHSQFSHSAPPATYGAFIEELSQ